MPTTIQVEESTKSKLNALKLYPNETYNDTINRLIEEEDEGELSDETIRDIKKSLDDLAAGRVHSLEEVKKMRKR